MTCRILLDTSLLWAGARGSGPARAIVECIISLQRSGCKVYWSRVSVYELRLKDAPARGVLEWARGRLGNPQGPRVSRLEAMLGRYHRWVRRIGAADVMMALAARELGAVLATSDPGLARFYEDLTGSKPIFIPVARL